MFKKIEEIKEKYGCIISDFTMKDFSDNPVMFSYEIDFNGKFYAIVKADYYMLSVETFLKFNTRNLIKADEIRDVISDLDNLRLEIKNYFENLRESLDI